MAALELKWSAKSFVIEGIEEVSSDNVLSFENESDGFKDEFTRVIDNEKINNAEDLTLQELGVEDPYIDMELGL